MGPDQIGFWSENLLGADRGVRKVDPLENLIISKFGFVYFGPKQAWAELGQALPKFESGIDIKFNFKKISKNFQWIFMW